MISLYFLVYFGFVYGILCDRTWMALRDNELFVPQFNKWIRFKGKLTTKFMSSIKRSQLFTHLFINELTTQYYYEKIRKRAIKRFKSYCF